MNDSSAVSALWWVPGDVGISLPLGLANRELQRLAKDSGAGPVASWAVEDASRSCESTESTETIEGVLEMVGETV